MLADATGSAASQIFSYHSTDLRDIELAPYRANGRLDHFLDLGLWVSGTPFRHVEAGNASTHGTCRHWISSKQVRHYHKVTSLREAVGEPFYQSVWAFFQVEKIPFTAGYSEVHSRICHSDTRSHVRIVHFLGTRGRDSLCFVSKIQTGVIILLTTIEHLCCPRSIAIMQHAAAAISISVKFGEDASAMLMDEVRVRKRSRNRCAGHEDTCDAV